MFHRGQENAENDDDINNINDVNVGENAGEDLEDNSNEDDNGDDDENNNKEVEEDTTTQRISVKEKLQRIVEEERNSVLANSKKAAAGNKNDKGKAVAKAKPGNKTKETEILTTKEKNKLKNNKKVSNDEWDIQPCKQVVHKERKATTMKMVIIPEKIINVRKGKGWKLEVMVEYNTGATNWSFLHGAVQEMPELTALFMKDNRLNYSVCGYKKNINYYLDNKKCSQYDEYPRQEEDGNKFQMQQQLIHDNLQGKSYVVHIVQVDDEQDKEEHDGKDKLQEYIAADAVDDEHNDKATLQANDAIENINDTTPETLILDDNNTTSKTLINDSVDDNNNATLISDMTDVTNNSTTTGMNDTDMVIETETNNDILNEPNEPITNTDTKTNETSEVNNDNKSDQINVE